MATKAKPRILHAVPDPRRIEDVVSFEKATRAMAERREQIVYQQRHARQAAAMPDVVKDRDALIVKLLHRLKQNGADQRALLAEFADAMFIAGYMDEAGSNRGQLEDATLATIIQFDEIEERVREGLAKQYAHQAKPGDPA